LFVIPAVSKRESIKRTGFPFLWETLDARLRTSGMTDKVYVPLLMTGLVTASKKQEVRNK